MSRNFRSEVKKVKKKSKGQLSVSSIDGVSGDLSISNLWAANLFSSQDVTGYVPASLRNCLIVPIPKGQKDPPVSNNYRSIALAPSLSKILEWVILSQFPECFLTGTCSLGLRRVCPLHCALAL